MHGTRVMKDIESQWKEHLKNEEADVNGQIAFIRKVVTAMLDAEDDNIKAAVEMYCQTEGSNVTGEDNTAEMKVKAQQQ